MITAHQLPVFRVCLLLICLSLFRSESVAQYCDTVTPSFNVDLSANPHMSWTSPTTNRDGFCCGATAPDKCLEFVITLHPDAASVVFNITSGAIPPGALFYQIDCGPPTPVGSPICLTGTGPFHLTFCKPGNNVNTFSIETIPNPFFGPDITLNDGCQGMLYANFYDESTVTWTSITPGAPGTYNAYLNCTSGCDTVYLSGQSNAPPLVGYMVCGMAANGCIPDPVCDTLFTTFIPPMNVAFDAPDTILCANETAVAVSASVSGGTAPYIYSWDTGETTSGIYAGSGPHTLTVTDQSGCSEVSAVLTITQLLPPDVDAGADIDLCTGFIGAVTLNGSAINTSDIFWTGGSGTFTDSTALNTDYYPSAEEIANGYVQLLLISADLSGCPPDSDDLVLQYNDVGEIVDLITTDISCFGGNNGSVSVNVSGPNGPYNYIFDGGAPTSSPTDFNLTAGIHTVTIINALGCDSSLTYGIIQPDTLIVIPQFVQNAICYGDANGIISTLIEGGTAPYDASWNTAPVQNGSVASGLTAGSYQLSVTDANGCMAAYDTVIMQPDSLLPVISAVPPACFGYTNGAASVSVSGGNGGYSYVWNNGLQATIIYNLGAGIYSVDVSDSLGCQTSGVILLPDPPQLNMIASNDTLICPGTNVSLYAAASGGTGNHSYQWSPSGSNTSGITVAPAVETNYVCTITDDNGCSIADSILISTEEMTPDDLGIDAMPAEICAGDSSVLVASYSGNDLSVTLSWQNCPQCAGQMTVSPSQTTTYTVVAENYCGQTIDAQATVVVHQPPILILDPFAGESCPGEWLQFTNAGTNNPTWNYEWDFGDGTISNQPNPSHAFGSPGVYSVGLTVTDNNGCTSELFNGTVVQVNPQANASFLASSASVSILDPEITFINNSSEATLFWWDFGDGTGTSVTHPVHLYGTHGNYTVELWANNIYNCPDSTSMRIEVRPSFDIYIPNAFTPDGDQHNGTFYVTGYGLLENDFLLEIYDRWGEVIYRSTDLHGAWDGTYRGAANVVQDGVYTWVVNFRDITQHLHTIQGHVSVLK